MIKRKSRYDILELLNQNPEWKVVDLGCGAIGKRKNIIHSKEWIENRLAKKDKFWVDLYNEGNEDYRLWRAV